MQVNVFVAINFILLIMYSRGYSFIKVSKPLLPRRGIAGGLKLKIYGDSFVIKDVLLEDFEQKRKLYYLDMGTDRTKPPLVIIGGTSQTINTFTPHIKQIAKTRRLIIPEMRCQGRTELLSEYGTMNQLVADFDNLMKVINVDKIDLCGFSFGGRVALAIAAHKSHLVQRLSVTGIPLERPPLGKIILDSWLHCIQHGSMHDCAWSFLLNGYSEKFLNTNHKQLATYVDIIVKSNDKKKLADLLCLSHASGQDEYSIINCVPKLTCRTQVIGATQDRIAGIESVRALSAAIPGSSFVEMDTGHLAPFESPLLWRQHVMSFMEHI